MTIAVPPRAERRLTDYSELLALIQDQNLMKRRYLYYSIKIPLLLIAFAAVWVGFFLLGASWFQLLIAAAFGLVLTHLSFLSHDAAHRQIFRSGPRNEVLASLVAGLLCGMSSVWWTKKHTRHHAAPNQIGKDPDIEPTIIRFYPDDHVRKPGLLAFLSARQGWWFFPILTLEGLNLHAQSFGTLFGRGPVKRRWSELTYMIARLGAYITVLLVFLPLGMAAAFLGVQLAVLGVYMGCSFAPNHKGMPVLPESAKIDFFRRQVLLSRNISGSAFITFAMGGLNYQIEHHLFPSMPRPSLRRAQQTIRDFCESRAVPYTEVSLFRSYGIVIRYLNEVGLGAGSRDPFQCPLVAAYRPRG